MAQLTASDIFTDSRDPGTNVNPKVLGSLWINYNTGEQFVCKDNTLNKNVWVSSTKVIREDLDKLENSVSDKIDDITVSLNGTINIKYGILVQSDDRYYGNPPGTLHNHLAINVGGFYLCFYKNYFNSNELICYYKKCNISDPIYSTQSISSKNSITLPKTVIPTYIRTTHYQHGVILIHYNDLCYPASISYSGSKLTNVTLESSDRKSWYHTGTFSIGGYSDSIGQVSVSLTAQSCLIYDAMNNGFISFAQQNTYNDNPGGNGG